MDRADYYKKKGSTVDAKFARLHRRSIDQRAIRSQSFMDNRRLAYCSISPVRECEPIMMPPPVAIPKAAKKAKAAPSKTVASEGQSNRKPAAAASAKTASKPAESASALSRRERLQKWKEEKEMKKKQMAKAKKPEVFRVSKAVDRKAESNLYLSSNRNSFSTKSVAPKPSTSVLAPACRMTRSSTRTAANSTVKDTSSRTRAPVKQLDPVPTKRPRKGPASTTSSSGATKFAPQTTAPRTRQSARLAGKQPELSKPKQTQGKGESKAVTAAEESKPVIRDASINVTSERGGSLLMEKFSQSGFNFTMEVDVRDVPFTPLSPFSASNFMNPPVMSCTPARRRCSTPYSTRLTSRTREQPDKAPPLLRMMDMLNGATFSITNPFNSTTDIPNVEQTASEFQKVIAVNDKKPAIEMDVEDTEINAKTTEDTCERTSATTKMEPKDTTDTETQRVTEDATPPAIEMKEETEIKPVMEITPAPESKKTESSECKVNPQTGNQTPAEPEKDVTYFKGLITMETQRLRNLCSAWESTVANQEIGEEVCGEIRSTIGKAKLLMNQRFKQFSGLIKDCEFGLGEKVTHCSDLAGFWEMVYFQVEDVDALFKELDKLKANNWKREEKMVNKRKVIKKKPVASKKPSSAAAANRNAARERLIAAKAAMTAKATRQAEAEKVVFEGGFFKVESPARKAHTVHCEAGSPFRTSIHNTPTMHTSRTAKPNVATTPKVATTPTSQLFSPVEPRRSLRTKLCTEISKMVLSDKKKSPARTLKESCGPTTPHTTQTPVPQLNKENEVDLHLYLQPCIPVVSLNEQAEDLMLTEPEAQLEQLGAHSPKKNFRPRRSSVKPKDPFSPCATTRSKALNNSTNTLLSGLCSPQIRKTRKSSLGFGLSAASSLFGPSSTPVPCAEVNDLISFDSPLEN